MWHVTLATEDRRPLFADGAAVRRGLHALGRALRGEALLFCLVDDHLHLVVGGGRVEAGHLACRVHQAVQAGGVPVAAAWIHPVDDRRHLETLVHYVLTQSQHHGLGVHPAAWEGSCFFDLVGARVLRGYCGGRLRAALPRWSDGDFLRAVGLERLVRPTVVGRGVEELLDAVARALVLPDLRGDDHEAAHGRSVFGALAAEAGYSTAAIAEAFGCSSRTARRLSSGRGTVETRPVLRQLAIGDAVTATVRGTLGKVP